MAQTSTKLTNDKVVTDYMVSREVYAADPVDILVDAFRFASRYKCLLRRRWCGEDALDTTRTVHTLYFLTHFHSDHYGDITGNWYHGTIYTTAQTAALVHSQLGVPQKTIFAMDWDKYYLFSLQDGSLLGNETLQCGWIQTDADVFSVHLVPANHCPGAAMFVFNSAAFGCVIHTGDFRFNGSLADWQAAVTKEKRFLPALGAHPPPSPVPSVPFYEQFIADDIGLSGVMGNVDRIFLDNTFCDPVFQFPSQWAASQQVVAMLRSLFIRAGDRHMALAEPNSSEEREVRCAVVIGTYTIGKERIALAVQEAFAPVKGGHCPIHVAPSKYEILKKVDFHIDRFVALAKDPPATPDTMEAEGNVEGPPGLRTVELHGTAVHLPWLCPAGTTHPLSSGSGVSKALCSTPGEDTGHDTGSCTPPSLPVRYLLDILLVPLGSTSYPALASASGVTLKRKRGEDDGRYSGEHASALHKDCIFHLGDNLALDLSKYDHVLAVEPTGWVKNSKCRSITERTWHMRLPYSEHNSFNELVAFLRFINPRRVTPTVSFVQFKRHEPLFVEVAPRLSSRYANTQPLSRFFKPIVTAERMTFPAAKNTNAAVTKRSHQSTVPATTTRRVTPSCSSTPHCDAVARAPIITSECAEAAEEECAWVRVCHAVHVISDDDD